VVALGIDWGLNTLLSAGACRLNPDGTITALGAGAQYRAGGVLARQHRLRRQGEALHAKLDRYQQLASEYDDHPLTAKAAVLRDEARHVASRRSHLNDALAWSAARWATDQAIAAGATVVYVEDLRSMEARGMGKTLNTRLSQTVRGQITEHLRHIAAEHGIALVTVPPHGTSKNCPRCLAPLRHCRSPEQPTVAGWKWARCPGCGWQGDRDQGAWQRIAARGLTHQNKTAVSRDVGTMAVRAIDDTLEARAVVAPYASGAGPVEDRRDAPEEHRTPRAQATRGTLPATLTLWRPASGGTRDTGPATAPRSYPGPARERDLHPTRQVPPPGTRGGTRRGLPPERPRHPAPTGTRPQHPANTE
jgi:hypothetical protein